MLYSYYLIVALETKFMLIRISYPYFTNEETNAARLPGVTQLASGRAGTPTDLGLSHAASVTAPPYHPVSLNCQAHPAYVFSPRSWDYYR